MIVVNLCGAPGAGKSTGAAYVFSKLKMQGINCELVTEYAKDKVWEEDTTALNNQAYVFGHQLFRLTKLEGKVDVAITDSPLLLSLIYNNDKKRLGEPFNEVVKNCFNSFDNINFFIHRVKPYNPKGRLQTEKESDELSETIKYCFADNGEEIIEVTGDIIGYEDIVNTVIERINKNVYY